MTYKADGEVLKTFETRKDGIKKAVLAETYENAEPQGFVKELDVNGEKATVGVKKI